MKTLIAIIALSLGLSACYAHVPPGHNPNHCPPGHAKKGWC